MANYGRREIIWQNHNYRLPERDSLTDKDKAELYKRYIHQVSFYKGEKIRNGILVVTFKNGAEKNFLISCGKNYERIIDTPSSFTFDKDSCIMSYRVGIWGDNLFSLDMETKIANFEELVAMVDGNEE